MWRTERGWLLRNWRRSQKSTEAVSEEKLSFEGYLRRLTTVSVWRKRTILRREENTALEKTCRREEKENAICNHWNTLYRPENCENEMKIWLKKTLKKKWLHTLWKRIPLQTSRSLCSRQRSLSPSKKRLKINPTSCVRREEERKSPREEELRREGKRKEPITVSEKSLEGL